MAADFAATCREMAEDCRLAATHAPVYWPELVQHRHRLLRASVLLSALPGAISVTTDQLGFILADHLKGKLTAALSGAEGEEGKAAMRRQKTISPGFLRRQIGGRDAD